MRYLLQLALVGISFMVVSGCPPAPPVQPGPAPAPTPTPEPAMATCAEACDNLKTLGCPEGLSLDCVPTCEASSGQLSYHLDCLASAGDAAAAQACGSVDCDTSRETIVATPTCATACAQVKKLGCSEAASCLATCQKINSKINLKLSCLTAAKTKAALQKCGSVACK